MAELKPYLEYKESGVGWIGKIPTRWETSKLKYLVTIVTGNTPPKSNEDNYLDGFIPWVKPENLKDDNVISDTKEKLSEQGGEQARLIPKNSVLVCCIGTVGKVAINNVIVTTNQQINSIVFDKKDIYDDLYGLYSVISAKDKYKKHANTVVVPILNKNSQENIKVPLPDFDTQKKIGKFIEKKTKVIDILIAWKKNLIELLEEKRQATITETVIKGLDPNVKMKDSGIEWIGKIPEHWDISKIKYYSDMKTGATPSRTVMDYWNNGTIKWMTSGEVNQEYIYDVHNTITKLGYEKSSTNILPINTVMIALNGQGKTKGKVGILKVESTCNQSLAGFICDEKTLHHQYLYYFLKSKYSDLRGLVGDGLRDGISLSLLKTLYISLPKYEEQIKITEIIQAKEIEIGLLKLEIESTIDKLKEYRESLIYEAVTGKIDLRDYETESSDEMAYEKVTEMTESYKNND